MTSEQVKTVINRILSDEFEVDASLLKPEARLGEDLGLDSLDAVDLIVSIERKFGFRMDEEEARKMRLLQDIYTCVDKHPGITGKEVA